MSRLLCLPILLLWLHVAATGQNIPRGVSWPGYRGNTVEVPLTLDRADSLAVVSFRAYAGPNDRALDAAYQPVVSRSGRIATARWTGSQTASLQMPAETWVEMKVGNEVRVAITLKLSKTPLTSVPGSYSLVNLVQLPAASYGGGGAPSSQQKFYTLQNAPNGMVLTHGLVSRLVEGVAYWSDTGLGDNLWHVEPLDDNRVILRGPPAEQFSGTLVLTVYQRLSN